MSGAASVPLALLAIVFGGRAGVWFTVLAFVGLWVFAIRVVVKNCGVTEQLGLAERKKSELEKSDEIHAVEKENLLSEMKLLRNTSQSLEAELNALKAKTAQEGKDRIEKAVQEHKARMDELEKRGVSTKRPPIK